MGAHKPWFRFHVASLEDPKVQRLPSELFKAWVNLLCIAAKNDGKIPSLADAAYGLRSKEHSAAALIAKLAVAGLLDAWSAATTNRTTGINGNTRSITPRNESEFTVVAREISRLRKDPILILQPLGRNEMKRFHVTPRNGFT